MSFMIKLIKNEGDTVEIYVPDIYQENIYKIDYEALLSRGIKCLIFDLDNTIAKITERVPSSEAKELFKKLKSKGFKIYIASNSINVRVKPFAEELKVSYISSAQKPDVEKLKELVNSCKFGIDEIALIGDSMMDDVICGNTIGITTVLLDQIDKKEFPRARFRRIKEKKIQKKLRDNDLFTKGRYYV